MPVSFPMSDRNGVALDGAVWQNIFSGKELLTVFSDKKPVTDQIMVPPKSNLGNQWVLLGFLQEYG